MHRGLRRVNENRLRRLAEFRPNGVFAGHLVLSRAMAKVPWGVPHLSSLT
jgi:hypothetical protein